MHSPHTYSLYTFIVRRRWRCRRGWKINQTFIKSTSHLYAHSSSFFATTYEIFCFTFSDAMEATHTPPTYRLLLFLPRVFSDFLQQIFSQVFHITMMNFVWEWWREHTVSHTHTLMDDAMHTNNAHVCLTFSKC